MVADAPEIASAGDGWHCPIYCRNLIGFVEGVGVQLANENIDFRGLETGHRDIKIKLDGQLLQFERQ
jgi:hypothetical protein